SSASARGAFFARYCTSAAPPARAWPTRSTRARVSAHSGVMAYRPRKRARRDSLFIAVARAFARPEEPVGKVLAHARAERMRERLPGVVLGLVDRVADVQAAREIRGERGSERAARAVIAAGQALPGVGTQHAAAVIE